MDAPKIVQVDRASATIHNDMQTIWGALREDGSVAWKATGCGLYGPENWTRLKLPEDRGTVVQVTVSCAVVHSNFLASMSLLYEDGSMASRSDLQRIGGNWSFDRSEPVLSQAI